MNEWVWELPTKLVLWAWVTESSSTNCGWNAYLVDCYKKLKVINEKPYILLGTESGVIFSCNKVQWDTKFGNWNFRHISRKIFQIIKIFQIVHSSWSKYTCFKMSCNWWDPLNLKDYLAFYYEFQYLKTLRESLL